MAALFVAFFVIIGQRSEMETMQQERWQMEDSLWNKIEELGAEIDSLERREMSWENINYWLEEYDVQHKDVALRQIALETGFLTSDICLNNHNLFGMRLPKIRPTTATGERKRHATYEHWTDSIRDYALWQDNMYEGGDDYYAFLRNVGYAECTSYINKLKRITITA